MVTEVISRSTGDTNPFLAQALALHSSGISILPIEVNSKKPASGLLPLDEKHKPTWKPFQEVLADDSTLTEWFSRQGVAIGIICGDISGSLEVLDFDDKAAAKEWMNLLSKDSAAGFELVKRLPVINTPSGGFHLYYRCPGSIQGNQKLAERVTADNKIKALIETRGQGGYVVAPPTINYSLIRGDLSDIPSITPVERELLLDTARSLNELKKEYRTPTTSVQEAKRPGDDYNSRANWDEILLQHGWQKSHRDETRWIRPGGNSESAHVMDDGRIHIFTSNAVPFKASTTYDKFAAYTVLNHNGDFKKAAKQLASEGYGEQAPKKNKKTREEKAPRPKTAKTIVDLVLERCKFFCTPKDEVFATIICDSHEETWDVGSKKFKEFLGYFFYHETRTVASDNAIEEAINHLKGRAKFGGSGMKQPVHLRVAGDETRIFIDLCNPAWQVVEIDAHGWRVLNRAPVKFFRTPGMAELPVPTKGGRLSMLRSLVKCSDADFRQLVGWLLGSFWPQGPYPILEVSGTQGSAKSSTTRILKQLTDPNVARLTICPERPEDVALLCQGERVLAFDNMSGLSQAMSDVFCTVSTTGCYKPRTKYTDKDVQIFELGQPVVWNGIVEIATSPDLAERCLKICLQSIEPAGRRTERALNEEFESIRSAVLGVICDCLSAACRNLSSTSLKKSPRLADFALMVAAAEEELLKDEALQWTKGCFVNELMTKQAENAMDNLSDDEFAQALIRFATDQVGWHGTPSELHSELSKLAGDAAKRNRYWPTTKRMKGMIERLKPALTACGIEIETGRSNGVRRYSIRKRTSAPTP